MDTLAPSWGLGTAVIALIGGYAIELILIFAIFIYAQIQKRKRMRYDLVWVKPFTMQYEMIMQSKIVSGLFSFIYLLGSIILVFFLVTIWHNESFTEAMRFIHPGWHWIGVGVLLGVFYSAISTSVNLARNTTTPVSKNISDLKGNGTIALWTLCYVVLGPIGEELVFRGLFYPPLAYSVGTWFAIGITAMFFSASHFMDYQLRFRPYIWLFVFGLVLTWLRAYSDSIWPSIMMHVVTNGLSFALVRLNANGKPNKFRQYR